jgi:hypothetical protein
MRCDATAPPRLYGAIPARPAGTASARGLIMSRYQDADARLRGLEGVTGPAYSCAEANPATWTFAPGCTSSWRSLPTPTGRRRSTRLISLGATHTDAGEGHGGPALMLDPDGNEFSVQRAPVAGSLSVSGDRRGESGPLALLSPCPRRGLRPLPLTWKQRLSGGRARYGLRSGSRPRRCSTR